MSESTALTLAGEKGVDERENVVDSPEGGEVESQDYVFEAARMRHAALLIQDRFKGLAKESKELAEVLDEHEGEGVGEGPRQAMLFGSEGEATQELQRIRLQRLNYGAGLVERIMHVAPEDLPAVMRAVDDKLKELAGVE